MIPLAVPVDCHARLSGESLAASQRLVLAISATLNPHIDRASGGAAGRWLPVVGLTASPSMNAAPNYATGRFCASDRTATAPAAMLVPPALVSARRTYRLWPV